MSALRELWAFVGWDSLTYGEQLGAIRGALLAGAGVLSAVVLFRPGPKRKATKKRRKRKKGGRR